MRGFRLIESSSVDVYIQRLNPAVVPSRFLRALTALFLRLLGERVKLQGRHHVSTHHMSMLGKDRVRAAYDTASGWPFNI